MSRAELYVDHQTLPIIADEGRVLTVGRRGERGLALPDVDLGELPFGRTVSRQHAELFVRDGRWFLRVEDTARNPTLIDGEPVTSGVETPLQDGVALRLGNVDVNLRIFEAASTAQVELQLDTTSVSLAPGGVQQITARLVNRTGYTEHFCVRLEGLGIEPSWYTLTALDNAVQDAGATAACPEGAVQVRLFSAPAHAPVPPLESVSNIRIAFHPPDDWSSRAGIYPFAVSATTDARPFLTQAATGQLTVESFANLTLGLGEDRLYKHRGAFPFSVANMGNAPAIVEVRGDGEGLEFVAPDSGPSTAPTGSGDAPMIPGSIAARLALAPGASARGTVRAHVRHWHWTGVDRGFNFFVTARAATVTPVGPLRKARPDVSEQRALAQLVCPPRIPIWLQTFLRALRGNLALVTTLILILGIAYVMLHPPEVESFEADQTSIVEGTTIHMDWKVDHAASVAIEPGVVTAAPAALKPPLPPAANMFPPVKAVVAAATGLGNKIQKLWLTVWGTQIQGTKDLKPDKTITYTLTAKRPLPVFPATRTITVQVQSKPKITAFTAAPEQVGHEGENVKLNWAWTGQEPSKVKLVASDNGSVVDEQIFGSTGLALANSATVQPYYAKETYELQLFGDDPETPTDTQDLQVTINKPTLDAFTATPNATNTSVDLQWQAANATKIIIGQSPIDAAHPDRDLSKLTCDAASGDFGLSFDTIPAGYNKWTYPVGQSTRFVLVACNRGGVAFKVAQSTVQTGIRDFKADPATVTKTGQLVTLTWSQAGAVGLALDPGGPIDPALNSMVVTPKATTTYILRATDADGNVTEKSVTVTVTPPAPPKADFFLIEPATAEPNQPLRFSYQVQGAKKVVISTPDGKVVHQDTVDKPVFQNSFTLYPGLTSTSIFLLTASGDDPTSVVVVPATVTVNTPKVSASASPSPVQSVNPAVSIAPAAGSPTPKASA